MEKIVKHTIGNKTYSKTLEVSVKYMCGITHYYKSGMMHGADLEADTLDKLILKKEEALVKAEKEKNYEVVTFGEIIIITTEIIKGSNEVNYLVDKTTNSYLMHLARPSRTSSHVSCRDKFYNEINAGDRIDVQEVGIFHVYLKDGELYFNPYGEEERVSGYFSNDIVKVDENDEWIVKDI